MTRLCVWAALCLTAPVCSVSATDPGTVLQTAAAAKSGAPGLARAGKGIAEVPRQAAQCFRLPLGLMQMLCSPLPDVTFSEGLGNTGQGLIAPFKLCVATLEMPYEIVCGLGDSVRLN